MYNPLIGEGKDVLKPDVGKKLGGSVDSTLSQCLMLIPQAPLQLDAALRLSELEKVLSIILSTCF